MKLTQKCLKPAVKGAIAATVEKKTVNQSSAVNSVNTLLIVLCHVE